MDQKKKSPDSPAPDFNAKSATEVERVLQLSETLKKKVFGQDQAIAAITKELTGNKPRSIPFLYGSPGVSKKEWARQMAEQMHKASQDPNRIIVIDEPMSMNPDQLQDVLDAAFGRFTRRQLGDEAAQACRDGISVTPMKQLTLKRGFTYL